MPGRRSGESGSRWCERGPRRTVWHPAPSTVRASAQLTAPSNWSRCSLRARLRCPWRRGCTALTPGPTDAWGNELKPDRARALALDALVRIDEDGAFANLVTPALLRRSQLSERDRGFVTELVYGTVRMRRACDWLVDRFVQRELDLH